MNTKKLKKCGYQNTFYSTFKAGHKRRVAIMIPNSVNFELVKEIKDREGRYILVQGKIEKKLTTVVNVHVPLLSHQDNI